MKRILSLIIIFSTLVCILNAVPALSAEVRVSDVLTEQAEIIQEYWNTINLGNWYENCFRQLYCADLSFPNSGTNRRGYIACSLHPLSDDASRLNGQFYYVHQSSRFQYPIQTAREYQDFNVDKHRRSYAPFERVQDYFVLLRNEDGVWRIRQ